MVEIVQDRIFTAIVCCDINPVDADCYDKLDVELAPIYNGTSMGWKALRPDNWRFLDDPAEWELAKPCKCEEQDGRWHYVCIT